MKTKYEAPRMEKITFEDDHVILTSGAKNPGNHPNCTVMPNGKDIPSTATRNRC